MLGNTIRRVSIFMLITIDYVNGKHGYFDNFMEVKNNIMGFSFSPMIPNLNFILYELFHEYLLSFSGEAIVTIKNISEHRR